MGIVELISICCAALVVGVTVTIIITAVSVWLNEFKD